MIKRFFFCFILISSFSFAGENSWNGVLGRLKSANFNSTSDQQININFNGYNYVITDIIVCNPSISLTAAIGGFYTGTSKSGTTIVAATQVYTSLTGSTKYVKLTLASTITTDILSADKVYFSLTTAQGSAATADIYIYGKHLP